MNTKTYERSRLRHDGDRRTSDFRVALFNTDNHEELSDNIDITNYSLNYI